jgi:hypothetical protein
MPTVFKFRITFEDYDEVSRDIEIKSTQTFEDLHYNIQASIGFDGQKSASFFMSNDLWIKEQEIALENKKDKSGNKLPLMKKSRLCDFISDPHQKILYLSDYEANWIFTMELVKIIPQADELRNYPVCVKTKGEPPKQYATATLPKTVIAEEDEMDKLLLGGLGAALLSGTSDDGDEAEDSVDDLMIETEEGVDDEELEGMGEEGEEESEDADGDPDLDMNDSDEEL